MDDDKSGKSTIVVRGVDKNLYKKVSSIAKQLDKTVGEVLNEAMELFIRFTDGAIEAFDKAVSRTYFVKGLPEVEISGDEIKGLDRPVAFAYINVLRLRDMDDEALNNISRIMRVNKLIVEGRVNKVKLYSKLDRVDEVVIQE